MEEKLTIAEEKFIDYIIRGNSQLTSYKLAFPDSTLTPASQRDAAKRLFHEGRIQKRYKELSASVVEEMENQLLWDKMKAVKELTDVLELNKREVQRYEEAYVMEMNLIDNAIKAKQNELDNPKEYLSKKKAELIQSELELLIMNKIKCNRRHQSNKNANEAILNCVDQLNKIFNIIDDDKNKLALDANIKFIEDINCEKKS